MATRSAIEWTEVTWNPVTGCTKISHGCKHCYAERMARRLRAMGVDKYRDGFVVRTHEDSLDEPTRWRQPRLVFVNSMSDLFHQSVPTSFIESVFEVMHRASQHTFQVLTKRPRSGNPTQSQASLGSEHMARDEHRVGTVAGTAGTAWGDGCADEVPVARATPGSVAKPAASGNRLGHRRRRIRPRSPTDGGGVGTGHPRQLSGERRALFLQAVGRHIQEEDRAGCWTGARGIRCRRRRANSGRTTIDRPIVNSPSEESARHHWSAVVPNRQDNEAITSSVTPDQHP